MDHHDDEPNALTRRRLLHGLGIMIGAAPLGSLLACSTSARGGGATTANDATQTKASGAFASVVDPGAWATGGTKMMKGNSPDPFAGGGVPPGAPSGVRSATSRQ